jgi:hypothetical protein
MGALAFIVDVEVQEGLGSTSVNKGQGAHEIYEEGPEVGTSSAHGYEW